VALGYPTCHFFLFWNSCNIYIYIKKLVPLHPYVPRSPTTMSPGLETQVQHASPLQRGVPIVDYHDCIFPGKGIASLPPGSSSGSMAQVRNPEVMKFFIMSHSLSLCLTGYVWFGQASSRSLSKWYVGIRNGTVS
jgi:hypothetical protein